jgi:hypothetical protein
MNETLDPNQTPIIVEDAGCFGLKVIAMRIPLQDIHWRSRFDFPSVEAPVKLGSYSFFPA